MTIRTPSKRSHQLRTARLESPLGPLRLLKTELGLSGIYFPDHRRAPASDAGWREDEAAFGEERAQLADYFAGRRSSFDLALDLSGGTEFQQQVWAALVAIPSGETRSYGDLATALGRPGSARAVGAANARNPVSIVVPCHRVIASDGRLTGYAGGVERKRWLLEHEGVPTER